MSVSDSVYQRIRRRLIASYYDPGTHLKEEVLAREFAVSRTPVRAAFQRLISEGLLTPGEKRGALVTAWRREHTTDIFSIRILLEGYGAMLSANNASQEQIDRLSCACDEMEHLYKTRPTDWIKRMDEGNLTIHKTLIEASGSPYLAMAMRQLLEVPQVIGGFLIYDDADIEESLRQHREIVNAIKARSPQWAQAAVACHLNAALVRFGKEMGKT